MDQRETLIFLVFFCLLIRQQQRISLTSLKIPNNKFFSSSSDAAAVHMCKVEEKISSETVMSAPKKFIAKKAAWRKIFEWIFSKLHACITTKEANNEDNRWFCKSEWKCVIIVELAKLCDIRNPRKIPANFILAKNSLL